jgi:hypothetical protein
MDVLVLLMCEIFLTFFHHFGGGVKAGRMMVESSAKSRLQRRLRDLKRPYNEGSADNGFTSDEHIGTQSTRPPVKKRKELTKKASEEPQRPQ